jgi:HK97 family phage portal protein
MKLLNALSVAVRTPITKAGMLAPVDNRGNHGGWYPFVREPYSGAWQKNDEWTVDSVLAYPAVFACITQISNDIGKLPSRLMRLESDGIWAETTSAAFSPVLKKPNRYQNQIQFKQWWIMSKLLYGNAYALKQRDARGVVTDLYLLDPCRVQPLVAEDGSIYYQLSQDNLTGVTEINVTVPASEIIHDRMNCLFHPLVGISPLFAAGTSAWLGLKMESDAVTFFGNGAMPGGTLEAPGAISDTTATRLAEHWNSNYTGKNRGKVAVLGDGLKYTPHRMTSVDAQQIQRSELLDKHVCACFHVPPYIVGLEPLPSGMKPGDIKQIYYDDCLHVLIEEMELSLDEGLALPTEYGVELDLDTLLRMDQATQVTTLAAAVGGAIMAPNEARRRMNLSPIKGGDTVYLQQQNYSLAALDERDQTNPLVAPAPAPAAPQVVEEVQPAPEDQTERALALLFSKSLVDA